ncbi:UDP-N-acetylmuramoyl-tripeptide--D-alanyl-D-alanine ligase [Pseudomarimonas salicorniae]|uniref:UDP-N-acetylmuramoyl-tripeptide--D-alanyl-D-alanine ligase n=1 Tax=Pseudomarimonas salicorniae TaxID=2933270 RepID=A0ABT0GHE5_9GAMM|nr:UDP-N-acetylmuramoyl-tripeptide--D-alanyl-D-alanine ligase [Lysobacter sp. CAU 1642]MCK7593962.1 UDP-N-acetylmuramoyl-tripeptide--D-alanyl-D-alanine ligase [Lysobacter sp. CAU 1642]
MKPLSLAFIAHSVGVAVPKGEAELRIERVVTDSRELRPGDLFVALRGERADGHDFLPQAMERGATAALVTTPRSDVVLPQLRVTDALHALAQLAAALRRERRTQVLALTGSNGKTTVKTLLASILEQVGPTWATPGNRNNELGMPLAVIDQPEDARFAVYELGAGQPGDIAHLAAIAMPQVALVNNVGPAHLERLGSLLGVAQTKGAIYAALPVDGVAVINADDAFGTWFEQRLPPAQPRLRFGIEVPAEVMARELRLDAGHSEFVLQLGEQERALRLPLGGRHNVMNALAAAAMAHAAGVGPEAIVAGLSRVSAVGGRLRRIPLADGMTLIDDSYNANPGSLAAAIAFLAAQSPPRVLVLGDMRELGEQAVALHHEAGERARSAGIERLLCTGPLSRAAAEGFGAGGEHFDTQEALLTALRGALVPGANVLVKGSRGSRMDRLVQALAPDEEDSHAA